MRNVGATNNGGDGIYFDDSADSSVSTFEGTIFACGNGKDGSGGGVDLRFGDNLPLTATGATLVIDTFDLSGTVLSAFDDQFTCPEYEPKGSKTCDISINGEP